MDYRFFNFIHYMNEVPIMTISENPLVSVIVPIYNVELYLDECLNSIRMQTYENLEIIVVEDCSTDNSKQVLQSHLEDKRIRSIEHTLNKGISVARNTGIDAASGMYIMFVDSDDFIDLSLVEACVYYATTTKADLITYDYLQFTDGIDGAKQPYSPSSVELTPYKQGSEYFNLNHYCWVKFIRFSVLKQSKIRFPVGFYYEDGPFHWHLGLEIENKHYLPVCLYSYRKHSKSVTALSSENGQKLLDAFTLQLEILDLVTCYKADEVKSILSKQITEFNFYNLIYIDSAFLAAALSKVKKVDIRMRENDYKKSFNYQNVMISLCVLAPSFISLPTLKVIRIGLHNIVKPAYKLVNNKLKKSKFNKSQM